MSTNDTIVWTPTTPPNKDELASLRREVQTLNDAIRLMVVRHEAEMTRLLATLNLRTSDNRRMCQTLAGLAADACPVLRRFLWFADAFPRYMKDGKFAGELEDARDLLRRLGPLELCDPEQHASDPPTGPPGEGGSI